MLAVGAFLTCQCVPMHIRNQHMGVDYKLSLKGEWLAITEDNRPNVR